MQLFETMLDVNHDTLQLALVFFFLSAFAELVYGMVSFGPAIFLCVSWQILHLFGIGSGHLEDSLVCVICMELISCIVQSYVLFKHANSELIIHNTVPRCLFSMVGTYLLFHVEELWLKRSAGIFMLLIVFWRMIAHLLSKDLQVIFELKGSAMTFSLFCANALSGISRGIFGIAGPPLMVFLTFFPFDKDLWRGSDAFVKVFTSFNQVVYLTLEHEEFQLNQWPIYLACAVGGLFGLMIGNYLSQFVDPQDFQRFLLLMLLYSGLLLFSSEYQRLQVVISCFVLFSSVLFVGWLFYSKIQDPKEELSEDCEDVLQSNSTGRGIIPSLSLDLLQGSAISA